MAVPVLQLNLAPRPSLWRHRHGLIGWLALGLGVLVLTGTIGKTWLAYHQASRAGRAAVSITAEAKRAARQEQQIQASLQEMDATREQSRWKLAERILQERSLPWSRLTAELEQTMVPDMRLKGLQRARSSSQQVVMKLKGEARTREAEAAFVEALRTAPVFAQVILERESERTGGGWDFELSLPTAAVPPPFKTQPIKLGPAIQASNPVAARPITLAKPGAVARPAVVGRPIPSAPPRTTVAPVTPHPIAAPPPTAHLPVQPSKAAPAPAATEDEEGGRRLRRPLPRTPRNDPPRNPE